MKIYRHPLFTKTKRVVVIISVLWFMFSIVVILCSVVSLTCFPNKYKGCHTIAIERDTELWLKKIGAEYNINGIVEYNESGFGNINGNITEISINDIKVNDEELTRIQKLSWLRSITLNGTAVTYKGLSSLCEMPNLEFLCYNGNIYEFTSTPLKEKEKFKDIFLEMSKSTNPEAE